MRRIAWPLVFLPSLAAQHGWVAETPNFRVLVQQSPGLDAATAAIAAEDLEMIRHRFQSDGLGAPRRADGPVEVLVVANTLELHALLRDPPSSRTRGITIRGTDRDLAIVPWHDGPGPRVILAHEYAHQLDDNGWPLWFREGRAVYLARRVLPRADGDPVKGLVQMLETSAWTKWSLLLAAQREDPAIEEEHFQAQAWLLVHWLSSRAPSLARLLPDHAAQALVEFGEEGLTETLRAHLEALPSLPLDAPATGPANHASPEVRVAAEWEIPLFEAEAHRALRLLDSAEARLSDLVARFPAVARVQAGYGTLCLMRGRQDVAERHYGLALELGDTRARTAYRYAVLLMRPGTAPGARARQALRFALVARDAMPREPAHQLAVVHGRMLGEDWKGAFDDLGQLARFPGWAKRAGREALEIERRRAESLPHVRAPALVARAPAATVPIPEPPRLPAWKETQPARSRTPIRRRWPPSGTWLTFGRVAWVDCSGGAKKLVLHSPYKRYVFRENASQPPNLINRPFREKELPCGLRGWKAAVAYRKVTDDRDIDGEIVAVRF